MEAATLKKKSAGLSKGKLKKTIKNVLCRPDSLLWPVIPEENERELSKYLECYKVDIPEFKKLKWEVLKNIPKEERPKPPALKKPDGLIFGLRHCSEVIEKNDCSAVLLDSDVNPKSIVQPIIEICIKSNVPVVCLKQLKELCLRYFGVKTACLGIRLGCFIDLSKMIAVLAEVYPSNQYKTNPAEKSCPETGATDIKMTESIDNTEVTNYLLKRISKKNRIFVPPSDTVIKEVKKKFIGQDFIEFSEKSNKKENGIAGSNGKHAYKNMKLKRIANNPNRVQMGKKRKTENAK